MIEVFCRNRLGNILFQYAVGRHLAIKNDTGVRLHFLGPKGRDKNVHKRIVERLIWQLSFFDLQSEFSIATPDDLTMPLGISESCIQENLFIETKWGFNPEVLTFKNGTCLDGNFQCEKYFTDIEQLIRQDFQVSDDLLDQEGLQFLEQIRNSTSVAVHVRRGDYVNLELHNVCNKNYYAKSIKYMNAHLEEAHYFVFSDDIDWCRGNLDIPNCTYVDLTASRNNPVMDFKLMTHCKHTIISNSTFSWWPAWLNSHVDKVIVGPGRWFNNEDELDWMICQDTIPDPWIRIDF